MKIALVWNHRSRLLDCSFRFEQYLDGFRTLGHDPVVVCDQASAAGFDGPLEIAEPTATLGETDFWRRVAAGAAVIVTWHRMAGVLEAMSNAGTRVIAIADTDGRLSPRTYPWAALERLIVYQDSLAGRLRCLKYWLGRRLKAAVQGSREDLAALASTRASDAVIFGHDRGRQHFERFLDGYGEQELGRRVGVVPFAIGASFLSCPVPEVKKDRIVAIGRWDDAQKHAGRLRSALAGFLASRTTTEVVIFGRDGEARFGSLARRHPAVRVAGVQTQEIVARALASARSIVFSSRWEGSPHAALEALALGATLIGPPLPSLVSWSGQGCYGSLARSRRPTSLARALRREMAAWDEGRRDPRRSSEHWRTRLAPEVVCQRMLDSLISPARRRP